MKKIALFFSLVVALSCSKDDDTKPDVASDFQPYLERFKSEASARNVNLNYDKLKIEFVDQASLPNYCGWGDFSPPHVRIVQSDGCWNTRSDADKEILIFHELGHSMLQRQHFNDTLPNGDYKSMMFDGRQFGIYIATTPERRQYYLDELFNPATTSIPTWATEKTQVATIFSDSITANATDRWTFTNQQATATGSVDQSHASTPGHSLAIESQSTGTGFSYWRYTFTPSQMQVGSRLVLKAKVRTENVTGNGAYVVIRGDGPSGTYFFATTQGVIPITGTQDFKEYSVKVNYFPAGVNNILVFLILDGDKPGKVYFDDVRLVNAY
jgi:hypothetical protein